MKIIKKSFVEETNVLIRIEIQSHKHGNFVLDLCMNFSKDPCVLQNIFVLWKLIVCIRRKI